ncbi:MAG TPA: efflux transporter outer membrane subunit [Steroidobacteraceae bacterium]|nr:efflux transporter outer membrane subunit [Steroidobacteraceae bacterium]
MKLSTSAALTLLCALAACSFTPVYKAPPSSAPAPNTYQEAGDWKVAQPMDGESRGDWWTIFQDPDLNALEAKVGTANQNIKAALARLQQARAQTRIQRAGLFPTLNLASSATRGRVSPNSPRFPRGSETVGGNFDLEADLSYEFDVWGRVRNSVNSAKASQQASAADLATLNLSLHAELATDYFTLRGQDAQQMLLDKTVEDYAKSLGLTQNLYNGGGAASADVEQAKAQLETARTQAADTRLQRAQSEHAIAVLIGENPSAFHMDANPLPLDTPPPAVDVGLPSALLERRPDVAAAERRVAAANFNIGVARAAYFPQFSLAASFGYDSVQSSNWLSAPSRMWSVGPSGLLTVFDAGRHRAQSDQAHAIFDEQVADYRNVVLTAYQEVEDNLAALRQLQEESVSQAAAVTATGKALQQSQYRYKAGLVTYLEVATNENASLQAQLSKVNIQIRRMSASVLLVKALGGGWQSEGRSAQTHAAIDGLGAPSTAGQSPLMCSSTSPEV